MLSKAHLLNPNTSQHLTPETAKPMKRLAQSLALLLALLAYSAAAKAGGPQLLSQGYWLDQAGNATVEEAAAAPFTPFSGTLSKGYVPGVLWLKLRIGGDAQPGPVAMLVRPPILRSIELYEPRPDGGYALAAVSGRDAPLTDGNHFGAENGFALETGPEPRDVLLRISTTTAVVADISLVTMHEASSASRIWAGVLAVYVAFLLIFCLWGLVNWGVRRDGLYGLFALREAYSIAHIFIWFGFLRYFFSDDLSAAVRDDIYVLVFVTIIAAVGFFDVRLISEFAPSPRLRKVALASLLLPLVSLGLFFMGLPQKALQFNSLIAMFIMCLNAVLAMTARGGQDSPYGRTALTVLRTGFVLMAAVVTLPQLMFQTVLSSHLFVLKIIFLQAAISTIVLFTILVIRGRQRDLVSQQLAVQYQVKERELQEESARRLEKERFLSMLTHELRNPLTVIRLLTSGSTSGGKAVQQAALEMSMIIERVEQSERLEQGTPAVQKTHVRLNSMLGELVREHPAGSRIALEAPADITVTTDEDLLRSIISNLLDNAAKYSPEGSPIVVTVSQPPQGSAEVTIANDIGDVGAPDVSKLFTKYYRSKGAHRQPGSGLGLFLVAGWVQALGGRIGYDLAEYPSGRQSVSFRLWLPA